MPDSKRDILLHIAATAEFKELKALNTELKESINTVARLRSMLKGDVGGTGLRGAAASAVEASKAQRKFKEEVEGVNASLTKQAEEIRAAGRLVKTQTTTKITPSGTESFKAETYDPGNGLEKEIRTRGNLVTAIKNTDSERRREGEELRKQKALGRQWAAEIESGATGRVRQANLERAEQLAARKKEFQDQKKLGRQWAAEIESGATGKVRQANLERSEQLEARKKALQEQKKLGRQWAAEIDAQEAARVRQANLERKHEQGIQASTDRQVNLERQRAQAMQKMEVFQQNEERKNELRKQRQQQKQLVLDQGKKTFEQQRARSGAVVTPVDVYNQKTGQIERTLQLTNKLTGAQFRLNTATGKVTGGFRDLSAAQAQTGDTMGKIIGKVAVWSIATGAVFGTIRAIKGAIASFAEIEKGTIAVARVTENFGQGMSGIGSSAKVLTNDILDLSVQYGQSANEAMKAAAIYGRLGMSQNEIADAMKYTMATANISGYGMEESAKGLASIIQQFQLGAKDIPGLVDKLSYVDRLSSATMGDLMEAGSRAAGVWHEAGGSVEEFGALIGVVAQRTGRSGAEISNAVKTIVNRLGSAETQKKLFELSGVSVRDAKGAFKDPLSIFRELKGKTDSMISGVAKEIEGETAGARQVNFLVNILKGIPEIEKQIEAQSKAAGAAMQQNAMYMEGMASKAAQLAAAWDKFTYALTNGAAAEGMKWWLDRIREALDMMPKDEREQQAVERKKLLDTATEKDFDQLRNHLGGVKSDRFKNLGSYEELRQLAYDMKRKFDNEARQGEIIGRKIQKEMERRALVEKVMQRPYDEKTDSDMFKPYQQRVDEYNQRKRLEQNKGKFWGRAKELADTQGMARESGAGFWDRAKTKLDVFGKFEYMHQLDAFEDRLREIDRKTKLEMRIEDEFAITPLEAMEKKLKIIDASIRKLQTVQGAFPALKDSGAAAEKTKESIKQLRDARANITDSMPEEDIKQRAKEDMKKMVAARESKEFLAGRIARSSLSGKEETAGLRESLALLAQNRESIKGYKQELMTLSVSTAGREMTDDEKVRELNLRKEIHELEMRDAALVGRVDRERVEAMLKVKEAAQKTYETTRKAMGQLSDVDMARARITAGRFKRGELKQFGEEAWNMPVEMRKQFTDMESLFPGMRIMPEMNSTPQDWFTRAERKGPNGERAFQPFAPIYDEATKGLTLSMNIGDAENKIDALGNSLIAYLSTNIGQLWDELIARTDAAARPPQTKKVQGTVR